MGSQEAHWIAPLVEQCLSTFCDGASKVEDNGQNLRFTIRSQQYALINNWTEGERPVPNLTDSKTQIDASLSQDSLDIYGKESSDKPLNKDVKGYTMVLYDFDVVFEYATSQPSAYLYVRRFAIAWDRGKFKGPPLGRKLKKHPSTAHALGKALAKLRDPVSKSPFKERMGSHLSQRNEAPYKSPTQSFSQSQVQPQTQAQTQAPLILNSNSRRLSRQLSNGRLSVDSLLEYLAPAVGTAGDPNIARSANGQILDQAAIDDRISSQPSAQPEISGHSGPGPAHDVHHSQPPTSPPTSTRSAAQPHAEPEGQHVGRGEDEEMGQEIEIGANTALQKEPSETAVIQSAERGPRSVEKAHATGRIAKARPDQTQTDPWSGMRQIRKLDITVPSNQQQFFEREARVWVPPPLGEDLPRACVPLALLSQWNSIALNRARSSADKQPTPVPTQDMSPEPDEHSSMSLESSPTSGDGTPLGSWEPTPSPRLTRPQALPEDSSPVKPRPKEKFQKTQMTEPETQVNRSQTDAPVEPPSTTSDSSRIAAFSSEKVAVEEHGSANGLAPDKTGDVASSPTRQSESDDDSEDSVMDTSVPCPLLGSSQAYPASQSDQGVSSSGPPLPEAPLQERVQVTETPAANQHRGIHLAQQAKDDNKGNSEPLAAESKSSSQSRIFNTYATHEGAQMDTQNTPQASQADGGSQHIDILGTQLSSVAWSTQDALPISSSAIPNSTYQSDVSSKPFSSHNEMISSIEADEKNPTAFDSSAPDLDMQGLAPSPMKRPASDEVPPIAKRQRPSEDNSRRRESTLSTFNIVSRRESYITHTDDCAEAQRVFEKFRNDYPSYVGDFTHFTELCSKLQALRSRGCLTRSFLWDDFIIKHLEVYTQYREQSLSTDTKVPPYEDFFLSNYSKPSYKKRSLTSGGIDKATSQYVSATGSNTLMNTSPLHNETNTSFTGSLVAKFSEFHAHSFGPEPQGTASDHDVDRMSVFMPSSVPQGDTLEKTPVREDSIVRNRMPVSLSSPVSQGNTREKTPVREDSIVSDNELFVRANSSASSAPPDSSDSPRSPGSPAPPQAKPSQEQPDAGPVIPETETESDSEGEHESSEDVDMMDETHETASLELGDGEESESENENWFVSLRHIREPGEGWWDDPNTPLKQWAKADQNVRSERVFRRDWARMPVDEKGVIQPWLLGLK